MAIAVHADEDVFRSMMYGAPRSEDREFLRDHIESAAVRLGRGASEFVDRARSRFESFDLRALDRKLDAVKRKVRYGYDDDYIRPITKIGQFQQAGYNMQRFVMANTKARKLFHAGRLNGYSGDYDDVEPGRVGDRHHDYKVVMNGLVQFDADGNSFFEQFSDAFDSENREELTFSQQTTVRDVIWANLEAIIAEGKDDPTDKLNGSL